MQLADLFDDCFHCVLDSLDEMSFGAFACVSQRFYEITLKNPSYGLADAPYKDLRTHVGGDMFYARALYHGHTQLVPERVLKGLTDVQLCDFGLFDLVKERLLAIEDEELRCTRCAAVHLWALQKKNSDLVYWILTVASAPDDPLRKGIETGYVRLGSDRPAYFDQITETLKLAIVLEPNPLHPLAVWVKSMPGRVLRYVQIYYTLAEALAHGRYDTVNTLLSSWEQGETRPVENVLCVPRVRHGLDIMDLLERIFRVKEVKFSLTLLIDACFRSPRPEEETTFLLQHWPDRGQIEDPYESNGYEGSDAYGKNWSHALVSVMELLDAVPSIERYELACTVLRQIFKVRCESNFVIDALAYWLGKRLVSLRIGLPLLRYICTDQPGYGRLENYIEMFTDERPLQRKHLEYFRQLLSLHGPPPTNTAELTAADWKIINNDRTLSFIEAFLREAGVPVHHFRGFFHTL